MFAACVSIVHTPLQVPEPWLKKFDFMKASDKDTHERQIYHSMVHFADVRLTQQNVHSAFSMVGVLANVL